MTAKFQLEQDAKRDIIRAKKMEQYLRLFKQLGTQENIESIEKGAIVASLEEEAFAQVAKKVGQSLGIEDYSLFRMQHMWYANEKSQTRWGVDDVFEAELAELLKIAGEEAIQEIGANLGVSTIGNQAGNISQQGLKEFAELPDKTIKKTYKKIQQNSKNFSYKGVGKSQLITTPTFKSAKVDVTGYKADFLIEAQIQPFWEDFINVFTGANFTVKNYSSTAKTEVIHLGNTNLYKVFYGTLADSLNMDPDYAAHIFYHTINTPQFSKEAGNHIIHIRFAYELTGDGLYDNDSPPNRIDAADFFIYNDPASKRIWVRSTKAMIAEMLNYIDNVTDPLHSGIVLLKSAFV